MWEELLLDYALNSRNGKTIFADKMQQMSTYEREQIKPFLICPECKHKATFVKQGKDGKIPYFRGKHKKNCDLGNSNPSDGNEEKRKEVPERNANQEEYKLKLQNYFKIETISSLEDLIEHVNKSGKSKRRFTGSTNMEDLIKTKSLPKILNEALNNRFEDDNYVLDTEYEKISINEILCSFDDITPEMSGEWGMFYGYIRSSDGNAWLNSSEKWASSSFSIKLGEDLKSVFWNVIPNEWGKGVPTIVCGKLNFSLNTGKPYVVVDTPDLLYLRKRRKKVKL